MPYQSSPTQNSFNLLNSALGKKTQAPTKFGIGQQQPMGAFQGFQGFGNPQPNFSMLTPQKPMGPKMQKPQFMTGSGPGLSGDSTSISRQISQYNQQMAAWKAQQGGNLFDQGAAALGQDVANNNYSNQLQFQGGQALQGQLSELMGGIQQNVVGGANKSADMLEGQADKLGGLGDKGHDEWSKFMQGARKDSQAGYQQANQLAATATGTAQQALANYKDMSAEQISSAMGGMASDFQSKMQQLNAGLGPNGEEMTPQQRQEAIQSMRADWGQQRQQMATQINSMTNERITDLTNNVAQFQQAQAGMKAQTTQSQGAFDENMGQQMLASQQQRDSMRALATSVYQAAEGFRNQAQITAIDRMMQGMTLSAQLLQQFPFSPSSMFDAILNMQALANTDAGRRSSVNFGAAQGMFN